MLIICSHLVGKLINIFVEIWNFLEVFGGKINGNSILCNSCHTPRNTPHVAEGDH